MDSHLLKPMAGDKMRSRAWRAWMQVSLQEPQHKKMGYPATMIRKAVKHSTGSLRISTSNQEAVLKNQWIGAGRLQSALASGADNNETVEWQRRVQVEIESIKRHIARAEEGLLHGDVGLERAMGEADAAEEHVGRAMECTFRLRRALRLAEIAWLQHVQDALGSPK